MQLKRTAKKFTNRLWAGGEFLRRIEFLKCAITVASISTIASESASKILDLCYKLKIQGFTSEVLVAGDWQEGGL